MSFDIIVPIYNARPAVSDCLRSLEKHSDAATVVLIDDASTDSELKPLLASFADNNGWQLITHISNQGFVFSANEGLRHSNNDTILLNSDTLVTSGWLREYDACRRAIANLATASPFSNNATICSFPQFMKNNRIPVSIDILAKIIRESHTPLYPEIPTAVGFCMLITQQAIDQVGLLDENTFGKGYGEENDFSMRAREIGMRNVLCDTAFIAHIGSCSFSEMAVKPDTKVMQKVLAKHPMYMKIVRDYITSDPLKPLRQNILKAILVQRPDLFREIF